MIDYMRDAPPKRDTFFRPERFRKGLGIDEFWNRNFREFTSLGIEKEGDAETTIQGNEAELACRLMRRSIFISHLLQKKRYLKGVHLFAEIWCI